PLCLLSRPTSPRLRLFALLSSAIQPPLSLVLVVHRSSTARSLSAYPVVGLFRHGSSRCCCCVWLGDAASACACSSSFFPRSSSVTFGCLVAWFSRPRFARFVLWVSSHDASRSVFRLGKMSGQRMSLLSQINDREMFWNAKVLVSRMWHYRGGTDEGAIMHTDIVVLDKEGTHMYGRIPTEPAISLQDVLQEGSVYIMKRFMCKPSKPTYRVVDSPFMMQFTRFTTVDPVVDDEEDFPYCTYSLMSFSDIPIPDVIGRIIAVTDIVVVHSQHQAGPSDTRTVVLQDQMY
uniref:Replication protein A 70 kDa DNA-binding subunit B/D first OB fold domain-containing protein n=3 Tax=Aegilops tauschii subsp. strangulata TaxID=200361 RepID=A0A453AXJ3_AEGTS